MDYAKFIELVKARPGIYDKTDKLHANRGFIERSWTEIGNRLDMNAAGKFHVNIFLAHKWYP